MPRALYLHVPFCPSICPYCDFHKMRRQESLVSDYLARLEQEAHELSTVAAARPLETIYFGGGTPSMLTDGELERLAHTLEGTFSFPAEAETTIEADPLTFDRPRLQRLRAMGFNRVSIGLQSTQDQVLALLGRRHGGEQGLASVEEALDAGFEVSVDVITAVPGQDSAVDLDRVARTGVPHISVYTLSVEPYTPFAFRGLTVDEDVAAYDFALAEQVLSSYGLDRYEVSNYARPGHESRHNQAYWRGDYFIALGPSAAGFVPVAATAPMTGQQPAIGLRYRNPTMKPWLRGDDPERSVVSPSEYLEDVLMTSLRTRDGTDLRRLERKTGIDARARYAAPLSALRKAGLIELDEAGVRASAAGLIRLNGVLRALFRHSA